MRGAFIEKLVELADRDPAIMLLTGDLGFTVIEPFAERFGDRFVNVGVAEQNMVGLATGLAAAGFKPYVYSIATFASMRPYELVRNGPVLHRLPVRIVGVGGGFDYGHNGPTHHALEDVALMRAQPDLTVIAPADPAQASAALEVMADEPGPVYFRIGKGDEAVPGLEGRFRPGRIELIGSGEDVAIVTYGALATGAVAAANLLEERGIGATVAVAAQIAPPPRDDLVELLSRTQLALSMEGHYTSGGIGSLVAELIAELGLPCRLLRRGASELPRGSSGSPEYLLEREGLSPRQVATEIASALELVR